MSAGRPVAAHPVELRGRAFWKLSGSGNDFVVFDVRGDARSAELLARSEHVRRLCARGTGVGADGVVLIADAVDRAGGTNADLAFRMIYFNADGSRGEMCGNAALCSTRLAAELGLRPERGIRFLTDSGVVSARLVDGQPEIDLAPVTDVRESFQAALEPGEHRIGFGGVGVPHLVVLCDAVDAVDVNRRGAALRHHPALPAGANANFVSRDPAGGWRIRTFERGVEGETLACGTGATATGILLERWGEAPGGQVELRTRSGQTLTVTTGAGPDGWRPSLRGPARLVFEGTLAEL